MIFLPRAGEVTVWYVAFHEYCATAWLRAIVRGRFKHVSLVGRVPDMKAWVWLEWHLFGVRVAVYPDTVDGRQAVADALGDHALLEMGVRVGTRARFWPVMTCVSFAQHALGLRFGALFPGGLWRQCLANGARIVFDHGIHEAESSARSGARSAEGG